MTWILVYCLYVHSGCAPAVINNIASVEECQRVLSLIPGEVRNARCIQMRPYR